MSLLLYALCARGKLGKATLSLSGVDNTELRIHHFGEFSAVVSEVGVGAIANQVKRHIHFFQVISALFEKCDLIPFRFGTVFPSEIELETTLTKKSAELRECLSVIRGCLEYTLTLQVQKKRTDISSKTADQLPTTSGKNYLTHRKRHYQKEDSKQKELEILVREWTDNFTGMYRKVVHNINENPTAHIAKSATQPFEIQLLIPKEKEGDFLVRYAEITRDSEAYLSGPWPPFAHCNALLNFAAKPVEAILS